MIACDCAWCGHLFGWFGVWLASLWGRTLHGIRLMGPTSQYLCIKAMGNTHGCYPVRSSFVVNHCHVSYDSTLLIIGALCLDFLQPQAPFTVFIIVAYTYVQWYLLDNKLCTVILCNKWLQVISHNTCYIAKCIAICNHNPLNVAIHLDCAIEIS